MNRFSTGFLRSLMVSLALILGAGSGQALAAQHHHRHHHHGRFVVSDPDHIALLSSTALVLDQATQQVVYSKNPEPIHPIASITKLMTALVVLDANQNLDEHLTVTEADKDTLRFSRSHIRVGTEASRRDFLRMALVASENRAAAALGRSYPGGLPAFVAKMNDKARQLGMKDSHFADSSGLDSANVSTAHDLALLVEAAVKVPLIHQITSQSSVEVPVGQGGRLVTFRNTDPLVAQEGWDIGLSKTGFINESGQCLVLQAVIHDRPTVIVLLDSRGHHARFGDANRVRRWLEFRDRITTAVTQTPPPCASACS